MKRFKRWVLTFLLIVSTLAPMTVYAEGEGNIDNGGGGFFAAEDEAVTMAECAMM